MEFVPDITMPDSFNRPTFWFIFKGVELLVDRHEGRETVSSFANIEQSGIIMVRRHYLGKLDGRDCFCGEAAGDSVIPVNMTYSPLRPLLHPLGEEMFALAGRAFQIIEWDRNHQFCGRCGVHLHMKSGERAKECRSCGMVSYPVIAPAVIVAVVREGTLLLAHSLRFQEGLYSVLAGFVEAGETLEECVRREVMEEAGIGVTDIRYFGSMPWPFPNSLMVGFTARHAGGEITIDGRELQDADWYSPGNLPQKIPAKGTIARKLIDWFIEDCSTEKP